MKNRILVIAIIGATLSPLALAGGVSEAESIAELKAQVAELTKRLDSMDKYTTTIAKRERKMG